MKTKALADVYVDEKLVAENGDSFGVDYVDDVKSRVYLKGKGDKVISVSIVSFNTFFK